MAALAKLKEGDPAVAERFELYMGGMEIANGFSELTDAQEQRRRFEEALEARAAKDLARYAMPEPFLAALEGLPPCAGIALGMDRIIMILADAPNIDDVVDVRRVGQNHDYPVHAQRDAGAGGQAFERRQERLRHGITGQILCRPSLQGFLKAPSLFLCVGELRKAVGDFHAAHVELKALRDGRITLFQFSKRRHGGRIIAKKHRMVTAEVGFDVFGRTSSNRPPARAFCRLTGAYREKASFTVILSQGSGRRMI